MTRFVVKWGNGVIVCDDKKDVTIIPFLSSGVICFLRNILDELSSVTTTELLTQNISKAISCYYES